MGCKKSFISQSPHKPPAPQSAMSGADGPEDKTGSEAQQCNKGPEGTNVTTYDSTSTVEIGDLTAASFFDITSNKCRFNYSCYIECNG